MANCRPRAMLAAAWFACASTGAWKWYRTLKALGKTVEFDIYPRGGHVLYEPMLQREQMRRNFEWFRRWIQ